MGEDKKIKIRKDFRNHSHSGASKGQYPSQNGGTGVKTFKSLDLLEQTVKKIENKYKNFGFYDSKEEEFFSAFQGKAVVLELSGQQKVEGILEGVDKFRFCVSIQGEKRYYFKHALTCYYAKQA